MSSLAVPLASCTWSNLDDKVVIGIAGEAGVAQSTIKPVESHSTHPSNPYPDTSF